MELHEIDLNLLVVFNELLKQKRVAQAARTLGITQPAVSNALARLRKLLGDELFSRTSNGMQPTPYAERLAEPVAYALSTIRGAVNQSNVFDPATSQRAFTIGMTDIGEIYFLPKLMEALREVSPGITISTVRNTAINLKDEMEAGHVDLAIGLLPELKAGFFQQRLFHQSYVCLFRKKHRLDKKQISLKEFCSAEHVLVVAAGTGHNKIDQLMVRAGIKRNVRLTVPHFVAVAHILQTTDMVATVPERFAMRTIEPFQLTYVPCPAKVPKIAIHLFWHSRYHKDSANQWLRGFIFEMFAE